MKRTTPKRVPLNISINPELKRLLKIQMAKDETEISAVTEQLYRDFLNRQKSQSDEERDAPRTKRA